MFDDMNLDLCVVDTTHATIYDFVRKGEKNDDALFRAYDAAAKDIELYSRYVKEYPANRDYWNAQLDKARNKVFEVLTFEQFKRLEREKLLSGPLEEITAEEFQDALNVLPPLCFCTRNNVEEFCMSEMWTGTYTTQYAYSLVTGKYYRKMVDCRDKSTWISEILESMPE